MKSNLSWDEYFMLVAFLSAKRSKDPSTKVGACIVNKDNKIVGVGYNGLPTNFDDKKFQWENKEKEDVLNKYNFVVHAELNAILNASNKLDGTRIYVSLFPCNECAKAIIQAGIKEVIYFLDKYASSNEVIASKMMLDIAGVKYRHFTSPNILNYNLQVE